MMYSIMRSLSLVLRCFFAGVLVASCGSSGGDQGGDDPAERPEWVRSRPVSPSDYIGVGIVSKKKNPYDYASRAKNLALNEIASEISSNVSSRSVLNTLDVGDSFFENYQSDTQVKSDIWLEGYTQVGAYENKNTYWVFYRLGKSDYKKSKQKKIEETLSKSKDLYRQARDFETSGDYRAAFVYLFKALGIIQSFWGEVLETELDGKKVFYGNELVNRTFRLNQSITIRPSKPVIDVERGSDISEDELTFFVTGSGKTPIGNLPIALSTSPVEILTNRSFNTDANGSIRFSVKKVGAAARTVYLDARFDIKKLIQEAGVSFLVEQMMEKIEPANATLDINLSDPLVIIRSKEQKLSGVRQVEQLLADYMLRKGVKVYKSSGGRAPKKASFSISITSKYSIKEVQSGIFMASYTANLKVKRGRNPVGDYSLDRVEGRGATRDKALKKLQKKLENEVKYRLAGKIYRVMFQ